MWPHKRPEVNDIELALPGTWCKRPGRMVIYVLTWDTTTSGRHHTGCKGTSWELLDRGKGGKGKRKTVRIRWCPPEINLSDGQCSSWQLWKSDHTIEKALGLLVVWLFISVRGEVSFVWWQHWTCCSTRCSPLQKLRYPSQKNISTQRNRIHERFAWSCMKVQGPSQR